MKAWEHFKTITRHKIYVMKGCFRVGLYRQGLLHDLSKYSPTEFLVGCKYYQGGSRSPNNGEREATGVSLAWLHHKGRNKHHFEYWIDYGLGPGGGQQELSEGKLSGRQRPQLFPQGKGQLSDAPGDGGTAGASIADAGREGGAGDRGVYPQGSPAQQKRKEDEARWKRRRRFCTAACRPQGR